MGQTLTHGVYLPDEGERNCYSGLAANWQILDTSVGTIAEHTSALAGKAPLAHTHTKSDITDLLNSNFIPSANNSYDLGSSSYQWNNLYAKNYYYNGVAWGLDKANEWSNTNIYTNTISLKHTALEVGVLPASNQTRRYRFADKNNANLGWVQHRINTSGDSYIEIYSVNRFSDGQYSPQGSDVANALSIGLHSDGKKYAQIASDFFPANTNLNCNLGTSTNKWKTLNGINPGALSLPSGGTTENTDWFDVAGDILPTEGNATSFSRATANYFTPAKDGWLALTVKNCSDLSVWCMTLKYGISIIAPDASLSRQVVIPVVAGKSYQILITGNSWASARLIMPQGNV